MLGQVTRSPLSFGVAGVLLLAARPLLALEAEAHAAQPGMTEPVLTTFIWNLLIFLVVLAILWRYAWAPLLKALDAREKRIRDSLDAAERALAESRERERAHEDVMANARREATAIVEEGRRDAQVVKDGIVAEARRESEALVQRAHSEIARAKENAVHEIHQRSAALAVFLAEKVIEKSLTPADHERLIQDTIHQYEKAR